MATEADLPAPICEKILAEGENIVYQATNISLHIFPQEKAQCDYTPNEAPIVEGEFLTTPSIGEVHCEASNISPNVTKEAENLNVEVMTLNDKTIKEEILCKEDYIPIQKGDGHVTTPEDSVIQSHGAVENQLNPLEEIVTNCSNPEITEKANEGLSIQVGASKVECGEQLEKESEKLPLAESSVEATTANESTIIHKLKIEDADLGNAEISENEESTSTLLKEEAQQKEPVESLHAAEDINASNVGQDTKTSSLEEESINTNVQGITSDWTDEKTIDTQSEVLEKFSSIVSNEEIDQNSMIKMDTPQIKHEDHLEKEMPLATEASGDESKVMHEAQADDGELAELCENEGSAENVLKMETKIDEPVEFVYVSPEDIKGSALGQEIEKTSCDEEQTVTAHPQGILDEEKDDITVDAAETKETLEVQNVEISENEGSTSTLLKEEAQQKEPVESLHAAPEDIKASNLGQDTKTTSSLEEESINTNVQGITSDWTDEKTIDTQSEVLEKFSSIVSNVEIEENSMIKMDTPQIKHEDHLEKEMPMETEASGDESKVMHEAQVDDGELAELCENEGSAENVLKMETKIDEPVELVYVSPEDIKGSALGQEIEKTSCDEEQTVTAHPQGILDEEKDDITVDAAETKETLEVQNVATIVSNEKTEEGSLIQVDDLLKDQEHLHKENEKSSSIEYSTLDAKDDELSVTYECKIEDEVPEGVELFEKEKNIESTLLKEEALLEKSVESFDEALDVTKASALDQHTEITSDIEEHNLIENTQGNPCGEAQEKTIDVADTEEIQHLQNVVINVSTKDIDNHTSIEVDDSQLKHEEHLDEEAGQPSITEAFAEGANDESTTVHEVKFETEKDIESTLPETEAMIEKPIEYLQVDHEENKPSPSSDTGLSCSLEEQSQIVNSQAIMDAKALDESTTVHEIKFETEKDMESTLPETEAMIEKPIEYLQVDHEDNKPSASSDTGLSCSLEEQSQIVNAQAIMDAKALDESTTAHEVKFETEKDMESTLPETEAMIEKPIEYLQVDHEDNKPSASSDTGLSCSLEEQSQIVNSQAIMDVNALDASEKEEPTLEVQNVATNIPHEDTEENSLNQVDCSEMEHEEHMEKASETPSLKECSTSETNEDESKTMHERGIRDEDLIKAELLENEKNIETALEKEETLMDKSIESLPQAIDDIKASASGQDTETSSLEEQILTLNPQEILCSKTEEKAIDASDIKDETLVIENVEIYVPNEDTGKNSLTQPEGSQIEHEVHLEKEIEKPSLTEAPTECANDDETIVIDESTIEDACPRNIELFDSDTNTDSSLLKKDSTLEKPIEDLDVAAKDNKAFVSSEDTKTTYSLEEQTANIQGALGEKIIDATQEVTFEVQNVATAILPGESQDNSLSQVDCSQTEYGEQLKESESPSLEESSTGDTNEDKSMKMHEPEVRDEGLIKAELLENEKNIGSSLENEEAPVEKSIDSLESAAKDFEASSSGLDFEDQIPTLKTQENFCGKAEEETIDAAETKDESLAKENVAINDTNEDIGNNSSIQVNASRIEHEDACLDNESVKPSLTEASNDVETDIVHEAEIPNAYLRNVKLIDNDSNIDNSLPQKEATAEEPIKVVQVAAEDNTSLVSSEDTKTTHSLEEQTANAQANIVGEKIVDAIEEVTLEVQKVETAIACGETDENSLIQRDCSQTEYEEHLQKESENPSQTEASTGNTNEDSSKTAHEYGIKESVIEAEQLQNDDIAESTLVMEALPEEKSIDSLQVATEDIKVIASEQDTEASSIKQILTVDPKETSVDEIEEKAVDAADTEDEILENISKNVPIGDNEDNSGNQIDVPELKHEEHLEKESEKPSFAEASTCDTNDDDSTAHEVKNVDEDLNKVDLSENEKESGSALVKEAFIESVQVAPEDSKASTSVKDRETSSLKEQCVAENSQEIKDDNIEDKTNDITQANEKTPEDKIVPIDVANETTEDISLIQADDSQMKSETPVEKESEKLDRNTNDESNITHEDSTLEEILSVDDICTGKEDHIKDVANQENQDNPIPLNEETEDQSKETRNDPNDVIDQVDEDCEITVTEVDNPEATEDETIKISSEVGKMYEESNDSGDNSTQTIDKEIKVEISDEDEKKEIEPDTEVCKEAENAENNAPTLKINEEEGYLKDLQVTTAVDIADHEEKGSDAITSENLCTKDSDVNQDTVVTVVESPNCEQEESSTTDVSEDTRINNENVVKDTSLASEASGVNSEKTYVEERGGLDGVSVIKPAIENPVEAFPKESTEPQVPDGEKQTELGLHDPEAETGEMEIKDEQPASASPGISQSNEVNGEEENRSSDSCKETSEISNTVALEEAENKEVQKQHDDHILAHSNDLSTVKTEDDGPLCGATVDESDILEQVQMIDETSLPAPTENVVEKTDCYESKVAEDAKDKYVEQLEQEDVANSFLDDQKLPENEQEEAQYCLSTGKTEDDAQLCGAPVDESDIPQMKKIDETSVLTPDENIIEKTDIDESEVVEITKDKYVEHLEQEDATKSFSDDQKLPENEQEEAQVNDISTGKTEEDVPLCRAPVDESDIPEQMQKIDEPSIPAPDENVIEKTDSDESKVSEDVKDKYIEQLEQEDATESFLGDKKLPEREQDEAQCTPEEAILDEKKEEIKDSTSIPSTKETSEVDSFTSESDLSINKEVLHIGKTVSGEDEEEEAKQPNISDFSPAAPVMTEAKLMNEAPEETFTCEVAAQGDIVSETTDTTESSLTNNNTYLEDIHVNSKLIEELDPKLKDDDPETIEMNRDVTKDQEVEVTTVKSSDLVSEQAECAFAGVIEEESYSNKGEVSQGENKAGYEFINEDVKELKSQEIPFQGHHTEGITGSNETGDETEHVNVEEVNEEVEVTRDLETPALVSERAESEHAFAGVMEENSNSNEAEVAQGENKAGYEFTDEDVKEPKSQEIQLQGHHTEEGVIRGNETGDETKCVSVEEVTEENITFVPEEQLHQESSLEIQTVKDESTSKMPCGEEEEEKSVELGQEGSLKDEESLNCKVDDIIDSDSASKQIHEPENLEKVLETISQIESCDIISKAEEMKTEEETLEAAKEIKSDKIVSDEKVEPEETTYETEETTKVDFLSEKIEKDGEDVQDYHLGSCKEEVTAESLEYEIKQEEKIYTEENYEVINNASDNVKDYGVIEEASDKAVEEPRDTLSANESTEIIQKEPAVSVEEEAPGLDHVCIKTGTEGSTEEVKNSFLEDENDNTRADDLEIKMTKDEGLPVEDSKIPEICAAAGELQALDQNIKCEDAPITAAHITVVDSEGNEEYIHTNIMQQKQDDIQSKHESLPLPELTQGEESEKQDEKDKSCSLDEVQAEEEENVTLAAGSSKDVEQKDDTCTKPIENEDRNTYIEDEKLVSSPHTTDKSEVSHSYSTQDIPKDNEYAAKNECSEEKYPDESTESQISTVSKDVELLEQAAKATPINAAVVQEETGRDIQQAKDVSDECEGIKTFTSTEATKISTSKIMEVEDQETEELTKPHDLPEESHVVDCEMKMTEKDDQVETVSDIKEDVQELNEGSVDVSKEDNDLAQESHVKDSEVKIADKDGPVDIKGVSDICEDDLAETSRVVTKEMVSESNIHQSSIEDAAQRAKDHESHTQIDSLPILPSPKCSDSEIAEKDDVKEEVIHLPAEDRYSVPEADHIENASSEIGDTNISVIQHGASTECSPEAGAIPKSSTPEKGESKCEQEETSCEKSESTETNKNSLSDLLRVSIKETLKTDDHSSYEQEPTIHGEEYMQVENPNETEHDEAKTDEEKENEDESCEHKTSDSGSEAAVMVEAGDADVKVTPKKSHNILSGVGSKVKHSIAKVKKAITGKSSHPKPPSPKSGEKY